MKFLHTSDWHLGITFKGRSAAEDQKYFIDRIINIAKEKKVDAIMVAGDIFDRSMPSGETVAFYDDIMTEIVVNNNIPVLSIAGNHDSAERLSQCHELLKKAGLYVAGSLNRNFQIVSYDTAQVYLLPWFSADKVKAVFPERANEVTSMEEAFKVVLSEMKKTFEDGKKHILVAHAFVSGSETSTSDKAAEIGTATAVGRGIFEDFDYVALGHIHKPQSIQDNIRYCGTPMPYSFGKEEKQEKGVIILNTDDMSKEFVPLKLLHQRNTLTGTYDELAKAELADEVRDGYLRLEVTDQYVGPDTFAYFAEIYPLLLEMQGLDYSEDGAEITLSMEAFEEKSNDPEEIFKSFCAENKLEFTDDNLTLFREVLNELAEEG